MEKLKKIAKYTDKELQEFINESEFGTKPRNLAVEEQKRRQLNKIGKNTWLTIFTFIFVVLAFILGVVSFILNWLYD